MHVEYMNVEYYFCSPANTSMACRESLLIYVFYVFVPASLQSTKHTQYFCMTLSRLRAVPIFPLQFVEPRKDIAKTGMSFRGSTNSRGKIGTARSLDPISRPNTRSRGGSSLQIWPCHRKLGHTQILIVILIDKTLTVSQAMVATPWIRPCVGSCIPPAHKLRLGDINTVNVTGESKTIRVLCGSAVGLCLDRVEVNSPFKYQDSAYGLSEFLSLTAP